MEVNLKSDAYESFKKGSFINRELNLASNRDNYINERLFFEDAKFGNATLTAVEKINNSYYVAWDDTFGDLQVYSDEKYNPHPYVESRTRVRHGFVEDRVSMNLRMK